MIHQGCFQDSKYNDRVHSFVVDGISGLKNDNSCELSTGKSTSLFIAAEKRLLD